MNDDKVKFEVLCTYETFISGECLLTQLRELLAAVVNMETTFGSRVKTEMLDQIENAIQKVKHDPLPETK